jgi:hypothetical protein
LSDGLLIGLGILTAVAAAARSTWSPCGLSMLSSITPFGEKGRRHHYAATATWYLIGAVLGGLTLGAAAAGLAALLAATGARGSDAVTFVATAAALLAAGIDAGVFGDRLPILRRQVDDGWLDRYRSWFYGAGFGWQIGVGVATYIMTAGVFLVVVLAAVTAEPWAALAVCGAFGLARGATVFLTAGAGTPARLRALHRRIDRAGPAVRLLVILTALVVAGAGLIELSRANAAATLALGGAVAAVLAVSVLFRRGLVGHGRVEAGAVPAGSGRFDG